MATDDTKKDVKKFLFEHWIWLLLLGILIYGWKKWGVVADHLWVAEMNYALFLVLLLGLMAFGVKAWTYEWRYNTDQFVGDNIHGSCAKYFLIGDWFVGFLGTAGNSDEKLVFPWPWMKKVVVCHKDSIEFKGNQIIAINQFFKQDIYPIPSDVKTFIEGHPIAKHCDEIYFGYFSQQQLAKYPEYSELQDKYLKSNSRKNELDEMLKGKMSSVKGYVTDAVGTIDKLKGKDWRRPSSGRGEE
ncbi:MAG: hypothetical protein OEL87_00070 [Nanoarchaeota archaeon]|nr:hypothetical protein [Nanoarchaeota archaeon]